MNQSDFIAAKHAVGFTIMETIKAVMSEYGIPLGAAKAMVASHPVWATVAEASNPLHQDIDRLSSDIPGGV